MPRASSCYMTHSFDPIIDEDSNPLDRLEPYYYLLHFKPPLVDKEHKSLLSIPYSVAHCTDWGGTKLLIINSSEEVWVDILSVTFYQKYAKEITFEQFETYLTFQAVDLASHYYTDDELVIILRDT